MSRKALDSTENQQEMMDSGQGGNTDYFSLFGLEESYTVSRDALEKSYIALQRRMHPDRFASDPGGQALAIRYASFINTAYETLKSPLKRAQYLLSLRGVNINFEHTTVNDRAFLMEQMELREALSDIDQQPQSEKILEQLIQEIREKVRNLEEAFTIRWQENKDPEHSLSIVQKMYFMHKLLQEAKNKAERLAGV